VAATTRVRNRNSADGRQELDELGVDAGLLAFDVRGVDQEFGAVWLEEGDVFLVLLVEARAEHAHVAEE
jgi:hypothetical protein